MKVLVTDAYERKALAAVRHLGERGCYVAAAGAKPREQSYWSKYCRQSVIYPNPVEDADAFAEFLLDFLAKNRFDCLLPMSCYTTLAIAKHKREFEALTALALPEYDVIERVRDKAEILKVARRLGIGVPQTCEPKTADEARCVAAEISYPCVVKYRRGTGSLGIRYARSPEELVSFWQTPSHENDIVFDDPVPIIQEYIPGVITDVCCLFNNGVARAAEVHQRIRTYPPSGGWGVSYLTVDMPELKAKGLRLLEEVGWHGPGLVEFKVDPKTGAGKLMEVNTRFWGGLDVSKQAGVDFAYLTTRLAVDGDVEPVWDYKVGMRYRFIFSSELKSILEGERRFDGILDYLTLRRGTKYDLSLCDPMPHVMNAGLALYRAGRRLLPSFDSRSAPRDR